MKNIYLSLVALALGISTAFAQQQNPFEAIRLGDSVNSQFAEINPVISPDGNTLYFSRVNHPNNRYGTNKSQDIWYCERLADGNWGPAQRMPDNVNLSRYNALYGVFDNGNTLLISGYYSPRKAQWEARGLSYVRKNDDGTWSAPEDCFVEKFHKKNRGVFSSVVMDPDSGLIILSYAKKKYSQRNSLYVANRSKNGRRWKKPRKMKGGVNQGRSSNISPYISAGGDTVFYASNRKDKEGFDIWYITKVKDEKNKQNKKWTEPQLAERYNSTSWDAFFVKNLKGDLAYFVSDREGNSDIYRIRIYEERPYAKLNGIVLNKFKNEAIGEQHDYEVKVFDGNGEPISLDSMMVDSATANFEMNLPFGQVYELRAESEHFVTHPVTIDLTNYYEYTEMSKDLFLEPLTFGRLKGKVLDKKTGQPFQPETGVVAIAVNGKPFGEAEVTESGDYVLKLSLGTQYQVEALAEDHNSFPEEVDFSGAETYIELVQDLMVERKPDLSAYVTLDLQDTEGNPLPKDANYVVSMNGKVLSDADYLKKAGAKLELKLPLDSLYAFEVSAEGYLPASDSVDASGLTERTEISQVIKLPKIEVGKTVRLNNIFFETGKASLLPESYAELNKVVDILRMSGTINIEIGGHTDNVGNARFNKKLSKERAEAVRNYLVGHGIGADRVTSKGYGFDSPIASNDDEEGRALNRRVEFMVLEK